MLSTHYLKVQKLTKTLIILIDVFLLDTALVTNER
jgi:hypothetical protein